MEFKAFIKEAFQRTGKATRVIILTVKPDNQKVFRASEKLAEEAEKLGLKSKVIYADGGRIIEKNKKLYIYNIEDRQNEGFEINPFNTLVLLRAVVLKSIVGLDLVSQLEQHRFVCVNSRECLEICADKFRTTQVLKKYEIPVPKTSIVQGENGFELALKEVGGKFPVIVKTLYGSQGLGVFQIDSMESLKSTLQTIWKLAPDQEVLIQEFIETDGDYRIHVINDKIFAAMKRHKVQGDFRANVHLGGEVSNFEVPENMAQIAINANKAVKGIWTGVDIIENKKTGELVVIEVNSSPGLDGIEDATGRNIKKEALDLLVDKSGWVLPVIKAGYLESMFIDVLDEYVPAKLDTGNGSKFCGLHADEYKIDEGKVIWKFKGKRIESKLIEESEVTIGGLKTYREKRPVISLDVKFNGEEYKNILFSLDNRGKRSPVLLNRSFIKLAGLAVDPAQKYILTVKHE